jgi:FMN-dependent NADH-azoreductase
MPTLLHLDSSADLTGSVSRALTARFAAGWSAISPEHLIVRRDLHTDQLPHLPANGLHWAEHLRTPDETVPAAAAELQQQLITELIAADVVLVGAPMYNWSVPSTLKAWIDYIHVPGTTAPFDDQTQPLLGKPVVIVSSRGAGYGPDTGNIDHEIPSLQQLFGSALGMEVFVVIAELTLAERVPALAAFTGQAAAGLEAAQATIDSLAVQLGSPKLLY